MEDSVPRTVPSGVRSCIFTPTLEEDYTPYLPSSYLSNTSQSPPTSIASSPRKVSTECAEWRSLSTGMLHSYAQNQETSELQQTSSLDQVTVDPDLPKLTRQNSIRKVMRRASSINKDLRRKIKSWSPFSNEEDSVERCSAFYTVLEDVSNQDDTDSKPIYRDKKPTDLDTITMKQTSTYANNVNQNCVYDLKHSFIRADNLATGGGGRSFEAEGRLAQEVEASLREAWSKRRSRRGGRRGKCVSMCGLPDYIRGQESG